MEFILSTDLTALAPKTIDFNFEQLKVELAQRVQHYNDLVVTEDGIKDAKDDRANLRKLREAIEAQRKEVKSACMRPYDAFEKKCKELTALIDAPIAAIDGQVKAFEDVQKAEKRYRLDGTFTAMVGDMASYLTFQQVFNPRWLNATYKETDAGFEMEAAIGKCQKDVTAIRGLDSEFETELLEQYAQRHDLSAVIERAAALKARKDAEDSRKAAVLVPESQPSAPAVSTREEPTDPRYDTAPELMQLDFRIWADRRQLSALRECLISNHIKYGKVE